MDRFGKLVPGRERQAVELFEEGMRYFRDLYAKKVGGSSPSGQGVERPMDGDADGGHERARSGGRSAS